MGEEKRSGFCKDCTKRVVVFRPTPSHVLHLLLTLVTIGLWLIVWIGLTIQFGGWRCTECGSKKIMNVS